MSRAQSAGARTGGGVGREREGGGGGERGRANSTHDFSRNNWRCVFECACVCVIADSSFIPMPFPHC